MASFSHFDSLDIMVSEPDKPEDSDKVRAS